MFQKLTFPMLVAALFIVGAPNLARAEASPNQVAMPTVKGQTAGLTAVPRSDSLNPEVAPPLTPSGTLNPEVTLPTMTTSGTPTITGPSGPLINGALNPTGSVPSLPIADPSQETVDPNPQSQVSGAIGTPLPGQTPPVPATDGEPFSNVRSGMHAPALGPKTGGAGQAH